MEFRDPFDEDSVGSDEEEALSFCDLVTENDGLLPWESTLRASNAGPADHFDFDFDFDPGRKTFTSYSSCPADDLFYQGRLLPLPLRESGTYFSSRRSYSGEENRLLLNEKLHPWRNNSQSSYWSRSISSRRNFADKSSRPDISAAANVQSKSKADRLYSTAPRLKTSLKWQFFTLGLMKTPSMKLEDMRLRQAKTNNNGVDNSLKRSVSWSYEEGPKQAASANFQRKSKSAKENLRAEEIQSPRSRGWKMLAPLTALNGCRASTNSVINCSTPKKRGDGGGFAEVRRSTAKKINLASTYPDQNADNAIRGSSKLAASKAEYHRLSFHTTILQVF